MTKYYKSLHLKDGKIVSEYDNSEWIVGDWRTLPAPSKECVGLNCCENIVDAMKYVDMEVLAEVEIGGKTIIGDNKTTCEKMRIIKSWKWEKKDSVALSIFSAKLCLHNFEKMYPTDKRPREAIEAAEAWLANPCEKTESAARSAGSAAWSAAWSAALSAALSAEAAAWSAAWSAASAARSAESAEAAARSAESAEAAEAAAKLKIHRWIVKHTKKLKVINT